VQLLQLSKQQWQSSHFLNEFFALEQLTLYSVDPQQLKFFSEQALKGSLPASTDTALSSTHELIVFAADLSFEKLYDALVTLSEFMTVEGLSQLPSPDEAEEFALLVSVTTEPSEQLTEMLMQLSDASGWEFALVDKTRPKLAEPGLLLMDMDSTTIQIECIDEIAKLAGVGEEVAKVTAQAMRGELDFNESLRGRVGTLKNADEAILKQVADNLPLMPGLERLLKVLKQHNWRIAIASGGFTYFADKLKEDLALDAAVSNVLEIVDGKLTGEVIGEIINASVKQRVLGELAAQFTIPESQTVAMGDGANDLLMLNAAALGVACHAKPVVRQQAAAAINHHGLDILLYLLAR
jgi:phosphoserine phosphatase